MHRRSHKSGSSSSSPVDSRSSFMSSSRATFSSSRATFSSRSTFSSSSSTASTASSSSSSSSSYTATTRSSLAPDSSPLDARSLAQNSEQLSFSFSGGGWLMVYMYGVAKALRAQGIHDRSRFIGTSAGSLAAIGLMLDADFDAICETVITNYVPRAHNSVQGPFQMREYLVDALTRHANLHDFARCNAEPGRCTVVYTSLSAWATRRKSTFASKDHLLNTLIASCCATPIVGLPFKFEGEWVMDGGVLDNQPLFADDDDDEWSRTITVSPNVFSGADIRPSRYIPPWWSMYPPSQQDMRWVYDLGLEDGLAWGRRHGFKPLYNIGAGAPPVPLSAEARTRRRSSTGQRFHFHARRASAASYTGSWKTVIGQIVGYKWVEDQVLRLVGFFSSASQTTARQLLQAELSLWRFVAICGTAIDTVTMLWSGMACTTVMALLAEGNDHTLEFALLGGVHLAVWLTKLHHALQTVNQSPHWQSVQTSILEMERHSLLREDDPKADMQSVKTYEAVLPKDQHDTLVKYSYIYRMSSTYVQS